jgi:hypothetical protein
MPQPSLLDRVRSAIRLRHYSIRTEEAYVQVTRNHPLSAPYWKHKLSVAANGWFQSQQAYASSQNFASSFQLMLENFPVYVGEFSLYAVANTI